MGSCNSSVGHSLERNCAGQLRRRRTDSASSSFSSSSSSADLSNGRQAGRQQDEQEQDETNTLMKTNEVPLKQSAVEASPQVNAEVNAKDRGRKSSGADGSDQQTTSASTNEANCERKSRLEKLKEGVDFIETEEDAEAVESAVVKIQSTFRGKKIRSKLNQKAAGETSSAAAAAVDHNQQQTDKSEASKESSAESSSSSRQKDDKELNSKVATMQVNDNTTGSKEPAPGSNATAAAHLPEEEAERAATKIQAGFKGYKTRKELEGKLGQQGAQSSGDGQAQPANDKGD